MTGKLFVGTSGYSYKEWKPEFYPADLKNDAMLSYYAERLPSVEINNTFYREPSQKAIDGWAEKTPESFAFAIKAPQKITHIARLRGVDEVLERVLATLKGLGPRLGVVLFQCPPSLKYDTDTLDNFLALLPGGDMPNAIRAAMEFRHASWDTDEVREKLAKNGVAWCVSDTDEHDATLHRTANEFTYLRLRKIVYEDAAYDTWTEKIKGVLDDGSDVYVYFKHEDTASGAIYAMRLKERLG